MCIIVSKPAGIDMPTISTLRTCWDGNPDGAGIMYAHNGRVHIRKGFMQWSDFLDALADIESSFNTKDLSMVLHFRIATHGAVIPGNCHPFPVCSKISKMHRLNYKTGLGVAHNGIIGGLETSHKVSDTMRFVADFIHPLAEHGLYAEAWAQDLLERSCDGSRLALLDGSGNIYHIGDWEWNGGIGYSNNSYRWNFGFGIKGTSWTTYDEYENTAAYGDIEVRNEVLDSVPFKGCYASCTNFYDCYTWQPFCKTQAQADEYQQQELEDELYVNPAYQIDDKDAQGVLFTA